MTKEINFNPETLNKIQSGVNTIANAVKVTLGPRGRTVALETGYGSPHLTKDGVTVAESIFLKDAIENIAAQIMKQAATKTVNTTGDGTTTSVVLAQALFNEGYKYVQMGMISPIELRRGLEKKLEQVLAYIASKAERIESSEQLKQIATISANNDTQIGALIAEAFVQAGENGIVLAENSKSTSTHVEVTQGAKIDRGYVSPLFMTNPLKFTAELENPLILFYDKKLRAADDVIPVLKLAARSKKPLLVIAEEIEAQALNMLLINKVQAGLQLCAIKSPGFGERREKILEDLAILTGGVVISEKTGKILTDIQLSDLGSAEKIIISKDSTTIVASNANIDAVMKRIESIKAEIELSESDYEIQKSKERIAALIGKVAVVRIGASTEIELKEKKDRVDDAIQATQAALKAGIVPGGGLVYLNASNEDTDSTITAMVMNTALKAPIKTICENAAISSDVVLDKIGGNIGFDANKGSYEDLAKMGIIDPALVLISALENAVSVANMLLSTSVAITVAKEDSSSMPPNYGEPQGMYDM